MTVGRGSTVEIIRKILLILILAALVLVSPSVRIESFAGYIFTCSWTVVGLLICWAFILFG